MSREPTNRLKRAAALDRNWQEPILIIDETTGEIFGKLASQLKIVGQDHDYRVQDLWLANQAIHNGLNC